MSQILLLQFYFIFFSDVSVASINKHVVTLKFSCLKVGQRSAQEEDNAAIHLEAGRRTAADPSGWGSASPGLHQMWCHGDRPAAITSSGCLIFGTGTKQEVFHRCGTFPPHQARTEPLKPGADAVRLDLHGLTPQSVAAPSSPEELRGTRWRWRSWRSPL